jgi:hypothetical protein
MAGKRMHHISLSHQITTHDKEAVHKSLKAANVDHHYQWTVRHKEESVTLSIASISAPLSSSEETTSV